MRAQRMRGTGSEPVELAPGPAISLAVREAELEEWARRRVKSLRFFYTHFLVFVLINIVCLLIDISTPGDPWFYKVLLGWGLIVGLHAMYTYELLPWSTRDWEQRKIQEFIEQARDRLHR
jgi:hypothetical protein